MTSITFQEYCSDKRKLGQYYGYPGCCIDAFMNRRKLTVIEKKTIYKLNFETSKHGFVPCDNHATEILTKKIKLEELITNRKCKSIFPNTDDPLLNEYKLLNRIRIRKMLMLFELKEKISKLTMY